MAEVTVVYSDLSGSTGLFEVLGNAKASQAIVQLTHWMGELCTSYQGQVIKFLGDGVLVVFADNTAAVTACIEMQRLHSERILSWPAKQQMSLQIGLARAEVIEKDGDFYGDAINVASRLSSLAGPKQILASEDVLKPLPAEAASFFHALGPLEIRGRQQPCVVYRVEWEGEVLEEAYTVCADLPTLSGKAFVSLKKIELSCGDHHGAFLASETPIFLGRDLTAQFVINDPRVSRRHAKIVWRAGSFNLEDVSSYGTWVRFFGSQTAVPLRRYSCVLHDSGEMTLGAGFDDGSVPTVGFHITDA